MKEFRKIWWLSYGQDEGTPLDFNVALKPDEGVPQNLVTA